MFPKEYYKAEHVNGINNDAKFIQSQFSQLPYNYRSMVADKYSEIYSKAIQQEPIETKKEGAARFKANSWLREFVIKFKNKNI